jgi:hypothetical protein
LAVGGLASITTPAARRAVAQHLGDQLQVRPGLDHDGTRARVAQDPFHLLGGGGFVHRHRDRASGPQRVVEHGPLVARARHDADPVALADAGRYEPLGERGDLVAELTRRDVPPRRLPVPVPGPGGRRARLAPQDHQPRVALGPLEDGVGQARGGRHLNDGRGAVLTHGASSHRPRRPAGPSCGRAPEPASLA